MNSVTPQGHWAVILCGGRGSRMGALTADVPKPLIKVHGEPILWYSFLTLYRRGFRSFILPLGYRGEQIEAYMRATARDMDCDIHCVDTGEDTSIAARIAQVAHLIPDGQDFLLLNSDTIFDFDLADMYQVHRAAGALVTLSSVEVVSSWGLILLQGGELVAFDRERKVHHLISEDAPDLEGVVNSGLAWLNKGALELVDLHTCGDFETAVFSRAISLGRAAHFRLEGVWFPIDTPKDLAIANLTAEDRHDSGELAQALKRDLDVVQLSSQADADPQP